MTKSQEPGEMHDETRDEIAIVGMAGRFPGAGDVSEFWENLRDGVESIRTLTPEELRASGVDEETQRSPGYVAAGAVLEDADCFDAPFFGYTKREAELMDPQHRVFLECAWAALEHAGYDPERYDGKIGVFGGVAPNTYLHNVLSTRPDVLELAGRYPVLISSEREYAVTRAAFKLDLKGPAISVNTACSTSGVALHLAYQSVLSGECDMAVVGGARVKAPLHAGYEYQEDGILSPDGHCRAFSADASGTVVGSGAALIVIKRLSDALRDNDTVHALILGTAVNNDGGVKIGYTAPSVEGQAEAIMDALDMAGIDAGSVSYIEAHGTGTFIGDPIEIAALTQAFRRDTDGVGTCAIGSLKTNIGHLDAGAGMAGVIKTTLALQARQIPPSLGFDAPNPQIDFASSPFYVNAELSDWPQATGPRRAGVSTFGLGGTNAHIVLEEAPILAPDPSQQTHHLLAFSAKTPEGVDRAAVNLADYLTAHRDVDLGDVAHTLAVGRRPFAHRRSIVAATGEEAAAALSGADPSRVGTGEANLGERNVVFMFPGGGAQYVGMGRGLYRSEATFRDVIDRCAEIVDRRFGWDLIELIYPEDAAGDGTPIERPATALPALFAVEYALAELLRSYGVEPDMMIGHSLGEYTAACVSGVLSLEDALALVSLRGELFETLPAGAMLSVPLPEAEVRELLGSTLSLAVVNKSDLCIVAGEVEEIDRCAEMLAERGVDSRKLHISVAAHSHLVEPILDDFVAFARSISFSEPHIPVASNTTGTWLTPAEAMEPEYWGRHLRNTVRFVDGLATVLDGPGRVLIEVGPGQTLGGFARLHPARHDGQVIVAGMRHPTDPIDDDLFFLKALGRLWISGEPVDLDLRYAAERRRRVPLPTYPFERRRYWIDAGAQTSALPVLQPLTVPAAGDPQAIAMPPQREELVTVQPTEDRRSRILSEVQTIFHELSGLEIHELDPHATFLELGFDSLFMTQATGAVGNTFGIRVSFRQLFEEAPTLDALAGHLDERLPDDAFPAPEPVVQAAPAASIGAVPALDGAVPGAGVPSVVQNVIDQQLEIMRQQLAALAGVSSGAPVVEVTPAAPSAAAAEPPAAATAMEEPAPTGPWRPIAKQRDGLEPHQQAHLDALVERLTSRSPGSKQLTQANRAGLADPRTVAGFRLPWKEIVYPVVATRSAGSKIWDVDGNEYLDVAMGFGVNLFGHSPQFVIDAVSEQLARGMEIGPQTPLAGEVAGLIGELTGHERAAFCNTGSEAVLAAMRLARTVTGRSKIVTFANDYHGLFDEVLARGVTVGGERRSVPIAPGIPRHMSQDLVILDYGDPASLEIIAELAPQVAAVLVEPVQSRHPDLQPKSFLQDLRRVTAEAGVALIFDEMITGFRSHPGGVQALFDVRADLATYGKVIGGGFPIGIVAGDHTYMDALDGGHWEYGDESIPEADVTWFAGTFVRHPVALAASRAVLLHMKEEGPALQEKLTARTAEFVGELNRYLGDRGLPMYAETFSSLFLPKFTSRQQYASLLYFHLRDHGIHITEGRAAFLSTAHSDADFEHLLDAFQTSVGEMADAGFLVGEEGPTTSRPVPAEVIEAPLTEGQQEIWLAANVNPGANCAYNLANTLRLEGEIDTDALVGAVQDLVARHDALRTTIAPDGLHQRIAPHLDVDVALVDLSARSDDERGERLAAIHADQVETPFDLETGPLVRFTLVRVGEQEHLLILTIHHVVCDGWSAGILFSDLAALYTAARRGEAADLEPPMQLSEYAEWQAAFQDSAAWQEDETFWTATIETPFPVSEFPTDRPRPPQKTFAADREERAISADVVSQLRERAAADGVTLFTAILGAFETYLHRLTGDGEVALGVSIAGQTQFAGRDLVGHCINMMPLRRTVVAEQTFSEHLRSTHSAFLDAFDHQNFSYGALVKRLSARRDPSRTPLVSVIFNMDSPARPLDFAGATGYGGSLPRHFENFDVFINVVPGDAGIVIECTYNLDLYDAATIRSRLDGFAALLEGVAADPGRRLSELPVVSEGERALLAEWNRTEAAYDTTARLHELFERQAALTPEADALVFGDRRVTYGELNTRANVLAAELLADGPVVPPFVGIFMDRSVEMLVAVYAVLKAGAGYVPLDPEHPADRLRFIIEEAGLPVVLTQPQLRDDLPTSGARVVVVDSDTPISADAPNPDVAVAPSATAYVIYTSGSTGRPKGVVLPHRAICNQMFWAQDTFAITGADRVLLKTPYSFDVSTWELFWPLLNGATLVIAEPGGHRDPAYLLRTIVDQNITTALFVPSMLRIFLDHDGVDAITTLQRVISSGEALTADLQQRFFEVMDAELFNLYGPTETAVHVTYSHRQRDDTALSIPIGSPVANTTAYVLDPAMQPVPVGAVGELHIGGIQVADGYLQRPDLTAQLFVPDPFSPGGRLYKTGDLARFRRDGTIEYLGRRDHQVKIRGNRIELGEIEATLGAFPGVRQAVVRVVEGVPGDERLLGYVRSDNGAVEEGALRDFLRSRLPRYMVPSRFMVVDEFPMTASGKVDRRALPMPDDEVPRDASNYMAPRTPLEEDIAAMWSSVLGIDKVGVVDDFFDLGGHSLDAMRVNARVAEQYGVEVSLGSFFENPTVEGQALAVTGAMASQVVDADELERLVAELSDDAGADVKDG